MAERTVGCPDCGSPVRPDTEQLCPRCGYPLMFLREPAGDTAPSVARAPGARDDTVGVASSTAPTVPQPVVAPTPPPTGGQVDCPKCGYRNEAARFRCERCGQELRDVRPAPPVLTSPPAPTMATVALRRRYGWILALIAVLALVAILAMALYLVVSQLNADDPSTASNRPASAALVPVGPRDVSVTASSVSRDTRFLAANTLDANRATMWQSDGDRLPSNVGVTLTYRFVATVALARITLVNGAAGDATAFKDNHRVARLTVRTDGGSRPWELRDSAEPQSLDLSPAPTTSVTLTVDRTYPGAKFPDLAITDVAFFKAP